MAGIAKLDKLFRVAFGGIAELDDDTGDDDTTKRVPIPLEAGAAQRGGDTTADRRLPASQTSGALAGEAWGAGSEGVFGERSIRVSPKFERSRELATRRPRSCQVSSAG